MWIKIQTENLSQLILYYFHSTSVSLSLIYIPQLSMVEFYSFLSKFQHVLSLGTSTTHKLPPATHCTPGQNMYMALVRYHNLKVWQTCLTTIISVNPKFTLKWSLQYSKDIMPPLCRCDRQAFNHSFTHWIPFFVFRNFVPSKMSMSLVCCIFSRYSTWKRSRWHLFLPQRT